MRNILIFILVTMSLTFGQKNAKLFRYPDVSESKITFVYGGDIWVVNKTGGIATKLSSPAGEELMPKFSPDGDQIAFTGNYDGNNDIYVTSVNGGVPERLTYHGMTDIVLGWTPDGDKVLFSTNRTSERQRYSQFYTVSKDGGLPEKLPVPYGQFASLSEDGNKIAYTKKSRVFRTWKRYQGGMAPDITIFDLNDHSSENISNSVANEELPMWYGDNIYYISDKGKEKRFNLWVYDTKAKSHKQLTNFSKYDIHWPSIGPKDIVFEVGGELYLYNIASEDYKTVSVEVVSDFPELKEKNISVKDYITNYQVSPDGKRGLYEARGEIFTVPKEHGVTVNLTKSSGSAERFPAWSPNGKYVAYWSDKTGEYELVLHNMETGKAETVTSTGKKFKYNIYWSPDSKNIAYVDNAMNINLYNLDKDSIVKVDKGLWMYEGSLRNFKVDFSSDSRWMAYSRGLENQHGAIFIYDLKNNKTRQVTSGYYNDGDPTFDPDGKYLYISTNRHFSPSYGDVEQTFIYANATQLAAISLRNDVPSPLAPRNDEVEIKEDKKEDSDADKKDDEKADEDKNEDLKIDFDGFEERLVVLPIDNGNFSNIKAVSGKLIYQRRPNTGENGGSSPIKYWDVEGREEQTIIDNAGGFEVSADHKSMIIGSRNSYAIVDIKPNQKMDKPLDTSNMRMIVNPMDEWQQLFTDTWRIERDYFYDENMHGVDWDDMKTRYGSLIKDAASREDVNFLIGELIGELNASHAYKGGGDQKSPDYLSVGYLGIDWEKDGNYYKIKRIVETAPWENEDKSPLKQPGVEVKAGDYILAVNGVEIKADKSPYAYFQGLSNKTVELTVNSKPSFDDAKKVLVKTLSSESGVRHQEWIEKNRAYVDKMSDGKIGYVYVRSTGIDGQTELVRQFRAQFNKEGLIIDERFNSGGQIPDRFIEMLNRKPLAFWKVRDGENWQHPTIAHFGPKAMLINGWSGSGGDAFPNYFRIAKLGKLIGKRTWGGLIGITGCPSLIDGGSITVPTFRMYNPDGSWFPEGHGVDPDIDIDDDPTSLAKGVDAQLKKAVEVVKEEIKNNGFKYPAVPNKEVR